MSASIKDIDYFLAVARLGRLSLAADELGVTQPALTKAVQRVEHWFGMPLFERTGRGMVLSSAGVRALEQLRRLKASYADTQLLANDMRAQQAGLLRIGVTDAGGEGLIVDAMADLLAQRPALRIRLQHGRSDALAALVMAGDLDAAIVPTYPGQPLPGAHTTIHSDPMRLVVRRGHPLARRARLSVADLVPYGWAMGGPNSAAYRAIEAVFAHHDLPAPRVVLELSFTSGLSAQLLARSDLLSLLPASALRRADAAHYAVLPLEEFRLARTVVLLARAERGGPPLLDALRDALLHHRGAQPATDKGRR